MGRQGGGAVRSPQGKASPTPASAWSIQRKTVTCLGSTAGKEEDLLLHPAFPPRSELLLGALRGPESPHLSEPIPGAADTALREGTGSKPDSATRQQGDLCEAFKRRDPVSPVANGLVTSVFPEQAQDGTRERALKLPAAAGLAASVAQTHGLLGCAWRTGSELSHLCSQVPGTVIYSGGTGELFSLRVNDRPEPIGYLCPGVNR